MDDQKRILKTPQESLDNYVSKYCDGDVAALFEALRLCCVNKQLNIPDPIARAIVDAIDKWHNYEVDTLDEAFSVTLPPYTHLERKKAKKSILVNVYFRVEILREGGKSIGTELFEKVGKEFNISGGVAKNYYYEFKNRLKLVVRHLNEVSKIS